jgi:hypothetical protein
MASAWNATQISAIFPCSQRKRLMPRVEKLYPSDGTTPRNTSSCVPPKSVVGRDEVFPATRWWTSKLKSGKARLTPAMNSLNASTPLDLAEMMEDEAGGEGDVRQAPVVREPLEVQPCQRLVVLGHGAILLPRRL